MSLQRYRKVSEIGISGAILSLALTSAGMCQTESAQEAAPEVIETLEEIIVYGDKSLHLLREDVIKAEEQVFGVFNSLNSHDEFDIHCIEEARTGTRIKTRSCRPNFVRNITSNPRYSSFIQSESAFGPYIPDWAGVKKKHRLLEEEMAALTVEHPQLLDALVDYAVAKQVLETRKNNKCEGRGVICNN